MPKIVASTNAQQRKDTRRAIFRAFGELLFERGLPHLTITDVAKHSGIGRTAIYSYFAGIEELLVSYTLEETERFILGLRQKLQGVSNPVERLGIYIVAQVEDLGARHLPPGPALRSVLSRESYECLAAHVDELMVLLESILKEAIAEKYLRDAEVHEAAGLVHGLLAASVHRGDDEDLVMRQERIEYIVRFIQRGLGARFHEIDGKEIAVRIR